MTLGRRSFMMSFWKIILHLNDLVFRDFFRNAQLKFSFTGVLPIMPGSLTEPASLLGLFFLLPVTEL